MHTGALKKWALALSFWLMLHMSQVKAQIFTNDLPLQAVTTGTNPVDFEFRADGTLIAKGNYGVGSLLTGDQGDGTRLLWFANLGALRAGTVSTGLSVGSGPWDSAQIGPNSVAFGYNTEAAGSNSVALGESTIAYGSDSIVAGSNNATTGSTSAVFGEYSSAFSNSFAAGGFDAATGSASVALGGNNTASGYESVAMGGHNTASGAYSTASGYGTTASGYSASASGYGTQAVASYDYVVGAFNVGGGSSTSWVGTDPLFEVGNGGNGGCGDPSLTTGSDALVVYKNGSAVLEGTLQVAPGGDIPMYTGE